MPRVHVQVSVVELTDDDESKPVQQLQVGATRDVPDVSEFCVEVLEYVIGPGAGEAFPPESFRIDLGELDPATINDADLDPAIRAYFSDEPVPDESNKES